MKSIFQNKKILIGSAVLLLVVASVAFFVQQNVNATGAVYQTEAAREGNISTIVEATGTVRAYQSVLLTWKTDGVVESVDASLGEAVSAKDMLASLATSSLSQDVIQADADLISAQRALDDLLGSAGTEAANAAISLYEAQEAYDDAVNYRELLNGQVRYEVFDGWMRMVTPFGTFKRPKFKSIRYYPSDEQKAEADQDIAIEKAFLDDSQREYDRIKDGPSDSDVAAAKAQVAATQAVLNQALIVAPFDGVITNIDVQAGDQVMSGEQALRVDNLSNLLIDLDVSEVDINTVSVGQVVDVNFDAVQSDVYSGKVVEIAGTSFSSMSGVGFRVTVELLDADERIKPGMTADVIIQVREVENALLIPNSAIRMLNGQRVVYVLQSDESLEAVDIRLGARENAYSEVVGGELAVGDLIVLDPPLNFEE